MLIHELLTSSYIKEIENTSLLKSKFSKHGENLPLEKESNKFGIIMDSGLILRNYWKASKILKNFFQFSKFLKISE